MGEPLSVVLYRAADLVHAATDAAGAGGDREWAGSALGQHASQIYDGHDRHVAYGATGADIAWIVLTRPTIGRPMEALLRILGDDAAGHEADSLDGQGDPDDLYCPDEMLGAELAHALCRDVSQQP